MKYSRILFFPLFLGLASLVSAKSWRIDSQKDWNAANSTSVIAQKGGIQATAKTGTYKSVVHTLPKKQKLKRLVAEQSPVWSNWNPVPNLGPSNLSDAPVFLRVGDKNYWAFGRYGGAGKKKGGAKFVAKPATLDGFDIPLTTTPFPNQYDAPGGKVKGKGGYHAWQSRDMKNWVHHGAVTEGFSRWVTSAEWKDGKAYIYYDYPNDQDPHVYVDDNLFDGIPGDNKGLAFKDPSDGSDSAFIRDLEGNFHVIYDDWSPIDANKRSWDSPLAGHAVSANGINGYEIKAPAVDNRTKPTGKMATYNHPHWKQHPDWDSNVATYEVHHPEQEAYGDWASVAIGGRYYLFGDFDPVGGHQMSVGWFTAPSIDEPFTWCDNIGNGHPDPDIGFAEGQFYLWTQQKTDYVSPGPWTGKVEVRVGVDTTNDKKIDHWTAWSEIKETYSAHPELAKQVNKTPAALDLSNVPAGHAVQFEVRLTDTTENKATPILDWVEIEFGK